MCLCLAYEDKKEPQYIYGEQEELISIVKQIGKGKRLLIQLVKENQEDPTSRLVGICVMVQSV